MPLQSPEILTGFLLKIILLDIENKSDGVVCRQIIQILGFFDILIQHEGDASPAKIILDVFGYVDQMLDFLCGEIKMN